MLSAPEVQATAAISEQEVVDLLRRLIVVDTSENEQGAVRVLEELLHSEGIEYRLDPNVPGSRIDSSNQPNDITMRWLAFDPDLLRGRPEELLGPDRRRPPQVQVRVGEVPRGGWSGPAPGSPSW